MDLSEVWNYFTPSVKRVFRSIALEDDRVRTRLLLGGLSDIPGSDTANILSKIESEASVELSHPETFVSDEDPCPDGLSFSPCVKETLNFFRVHQLRPVNETNLSLRLIQMGRGSTIRGLEEAGFLEPIREELKDLHES